MPKVGQEHDILYSEPLEYTADYSRPRYQNDMGGPTSHHLTDFSRIKAKLEHMRARAGLQKYPYEEGIEGLKTSLVCTLNIIEELVAALEKR